MEELIAEYKQLINTVLPSKYTFPVRFNHCFNRIVLDWLFKDCWYKHLDKNQTAISQLSRNQFVSAIARMNAWLRNHELLISDNNASLSYRRQYRKMQNMTAARRIVAT